MVGKRYCCHRWYRWEKNESLLQVKHAAAEVYCGKERGNVVYTGRAGHIGTVLQLQALCDVHSYRGEAWDWVGSNHQRLQPLHLANTERVDDD